MQTDPILKRLTALCAQDFLPWLGHPSAIVVKVESPEIPATDRRLDNLLVLQEPDGTQTLHLVEWQGYPDPELLWRVLEYLGLLGRREAWPQLRANGRRFVETERNWARSVANYRAPLEALVERALAA